MIGKRAFNLYTICHLLQLASTHFFSSLFQSVFKEDHEASKQVISTLYHFHLIIIIYSHALYHFFIVPSKCCQAVSLLISQEKPQDMKLRPSYFLSIADIYSLKIKIKHSCLFFYPSTMYDLFISVEVFLILRTYPVHEVIFPSM